MSESVASPANPASIHHSTPTASDGHMFAQVEKWMATIREISQQGETRSAAARLDQLLASVRE